MRILFYMPVITPWWFARIVRPMIAAFAAEHEVHVLAPPPWRNTGIGQRELDLCADLPDICWHIVQGEDHFSLRTEPREREAIVAFVRSLDPDYVLCRSADFETPRGFPGVVRHITEGAADPLALGPDCFRFTTCPFDHGVLPDLGVDENAALDALIEPHWERMRRTARLDEAQRSYLEQWAALPADKPVIFLPLEYEHEENFYTMHRVGPTPNASLLEELARRVGDRAFLALTNHPLNDLYVDNGAMRKVVRANRSRMKLLPGKTPIGTRTSAFLAQRAAGVILGDSKVYAMAGFHAAPSLRLSRFATGEWLGAHGDMDAFIDALVAGSPQRPDLSSARRWFAFHAANEIACPRDPDLTSAALIERMEKPVDPARWERNFAYFARSWSA